MPKPRGPRTNRIWNGNNNPRFHPKTFDDFNQHDDRDGNNHRSEWKPEIKRRVSFKTTSRNAKQTISGMKIRAHLEDDEDMGNMQADMQQGGSSGKQGFKKNFIRRNGSPIPRHHMKGGANSGNFGSQRKLSVGPGGWFQVILPFGAKFDKTFVLNSLMEAIKPEPLIPHYYKVEDARQATFYVDDLKMAQALLNADRKISMPDGFNLIIRVRASLPTVQIDDTLKEKMKLAMVKRYNAATNALDLTKFHADPDLGDVFCALFRPTIMLAAIDVIAANIPNLEALNLSDNKIHLLDHLKCLSMKLPNIKILYLPRNRILTYHALESLRGLPLQELNLDLNPFKLRFKDQVYYVSEIRKRFPKLIKLDGVELPPTIGFDINDEVKLPVAKASFLCEPAGSDIVRQFLEQYFILFDSDNRQQLLNAYHVDAMMSLTCTNNQHQTNDQKLHAYFGFNRNLLRVKDLDLKCKHLKRGRIAIVSFLSELPESKHDPQSFAVDLTLYTPQMIQLSVTGVFKERRANSSNEHVRSFQRSLIIVPENNGFCIRNEIVHINNANSKQEKCAFKAPVVVQNTMPSTSAVMQQMPSQVQTVDDTTKARMIEEMSKHSKMNVSWSQKCLEETNWDYQRAGFVFTELHKQHKIPPEAFV